MRGYKKAAVQYCFMDEAEIDERFSAQKENLEERFYAVLNDQKASEAKRQKAKERFEKDYRALIEDLQKQQYALYLRQKRAVAMRAPFLRITEHMSLWRASCKQWFTSRKQAVKKWFFDRKVRRILRDKSDL